MTISNSTPAAVVLVAIDIAKMRNEVLIEAPSHKRRRRLLPQICPLVVARPV